MKWVSMAEQPHTRLRSPCTMPSIGLSGVKLAVIDWNLFILSNRHIQQNVQRRTRGYHLKVFIKMLVFPKWSSMVKTITHIMTKGKTKLQTTINTFISLFTALLPNLKNHPYSFYIKTLYPLHIIQVCQINTPDQQ
jgi:hypothetical protein